MRECLTTLYETNSPILDVQHGWSHSFWDKLLFSQRGVLRYILLELSDSFVLLLIQEFSVRPASRFRPFCCISSLVRPNVDRTIMRKKADWLQFCKYSSYSFLNSEVTMGFHFPERSVVLAGIAHLGPSGSFVTLALPGSPVDVAFPLALGVAVVRDSFHPSLAFAHPIKRCKARLPILC